MQVAKLKYGESLHSTTCISPVSTSSQGLCGLIDAVSKQFSQCKDLWVGVIVLGGNLAGKIS